MAGGDSAIFRVTNPGDTETSVGAGDKIQFNGGTVPDLFGHMVTTSWHALRDISVHPNPNKALNVVQDGRLGTIEVILAGYFTRPVQSGGKINFYDWMSDPATSNPNFRYGRFGIRIDDLSEIDLTPSSSRGYILYDVYVERVPDSPNEVGFIAKLYRTSMAGTV